jgi:hypothetical protein
LVDIFWGKPLNEQEALAALGRLTLAAEEGLKSGIARENLVGYFTSNGLTEEDAHFVLDLAEEKIRNTPRVKQPQLSEDRRRGLIQMLIGLAMVIVGLLLTGLTYMAAEPGGRYVLFWGLVIFGGWNVLKGLWSLITDS